MKLKIDHFAKTQNGDEIKKFILKNNNGIEVTLINYGARIISLILPDQNNVFDEVIVGPKVYEQILIDTYYRGATVGRYANRIENGQFLIDDTQYKVTCNHENHHLHGGDKGFDKMIWNYNTSEDSKKASVEFSYNSVDGEEGYPGTLQTMVTFTLDDSNLLEIKYNALTDKKTVVNLTNHAYWNLCGVKSHNATEQHLFIDSCEFLDVDRDNIPTGKTINVERTPLDFRKMKNVGEDLEEMENHLYDHCFVLNQKRKKDDVGAELFDPKSGRKLKIITSKPCLQLFTGGEGVCLETQYAPNSMNLENFESPLLSSKDEYQHYTKIQFKLV